jgi:hypothetical protein
MKTKRGPLLALVAPEPVLSGCCGPGEEAGDADKEGEGVDDGLEDLEGLAEIDGLGLCEGDRDGVAVGVGGGTLAGSWRSLKMSGQRGREASTGFSLLMSAVILSSMYDENSVIRAHPFSSGLHTM